MGDERTNVFALDTESKCDVTEEISARTTLDLLIITTCIIGEKDQNVFVKL